MPGLADGVDDGVVVIENTIGEPVLAHVLPDVFDRVQLRRSRRQEDWRDVLRHHEIGGGVPSGAIHDEHGVCALFDMAADLVDMELHGLGVGKGQSHSRSDAARRADRAKQIGALVALVGRLAGPRSTTGPLPHDAVLLTYPRLVLT